MRRKSNLQISARIIALGCIVSIAQAADFNTPTAITNVRIVAGDGTTLESGTILFRDGVIEAVAANVSVPPDAEVIDGTGLHAYPGFIDAHSYIGMPSKERTAEERRRTEDETADPKQGPPSETDRAPRRGVRPQVRARDLIELNVETLDKFRRAGFTVALVAPRSGIFAGTSDLVSLSGLPLRRTILAAGVRQHSAFTTGEPGEYPGGLLGVFAQFRQVMHDARWYTARKAHGGRHSVRPASEDANDPALEAVAALLAGEIPLVFEANSEDEINRALDLAGEFGIHPTISGAREAFKLVERLKAESVPLIISLKWPDEPEEPKSAKKPAHAETATAPTAQPESQPTTSQPESASTNGAKDEERIWEPARLRQERKRLWEEQVDNAIRLHQAGIKFALSTREFDSPADFIKNLSKVISRGLPADAALEALAATPARMLGVENRLGAIATGKLANVVLFTKPLGDEKANVAYAFVEGRKFKYDPDKDKEDKNDKKNGKSEDRKEAASKPTTSPSTTTTSAAADDDDEGPTWRCEIEADRVPTLRTGGSILIQNATVYPVASAPVEQASVLIEKGCIKAIGRDVAAPPGVAVFDATGLYVLPGFIDVHSHMAIDDVNEGALAISAEVRVADVLTSRQVAMYRAVAAGVTAMHSMHGSANPIGGQNVTLKLKYHRPTKEMVIPTAPRTIKFALGENVTQANFQSAAGKRFPNTRMGVESVLRQALSEAREYHLEWDDYRRRCAAGEDLPPPRTDLRLEALADVLDGEMWVHCHGYRADEYLRLFDVFEHFGVRVGVLQHVLEGYRIAPEIARHGSGASTFASAWAYKLEAYDATTYNIALMAEAGINVTINSDSPDIIRHFNTEFHKPMRWGGMVEAEAIKLVTLNAAQQLGIADRAGSIEVGKDGDLAIFNGPPANSYSKCVMTLIEGEVYFQAESHAPAPPAGPMVRLEKPAVPVAKSQRGVYAITGATLHPVSGPPIDRGTVVMQDGRITAVGAGAAIPPEASVLDARGLHVYPGLIDAGSTLGLREIDMLRATRDNADIADFGADLAAIHAVNPHSAHIAIDRSAGVTSAVTKPSGGYVSGQSAHVRLSGWTAPAMTVQETWALHMSLPTLPVHLEKKDKEEQTKKHKEAMERVEEFIGRAKRYAAAVGAVSDRESLAATRRGARTSMPNSGPATSDAARGISRRSEPGSQATSTSPLTPVPVDLVLEAMIPYVRGEKPVVFAAGGYKHIVESIEFAEKHGLKCVIGGGEQTWKLADQLAAKRIPVILGTPRSLPAGEFEPYDSVYACAAALEAAGVEYAFGSESAEDAYELPYEVASAVAHGLDPDRAMYRLTLGAARLLSVGDQLGSIEPGKVADLIVTTGSPIQGAAQVTHMFIQGEPVSLTSRHTEAYDKFRNRPAPKLPPLPELKGPPSLTR